MASLLEPLSAPAATSAATIKVRFGMTALSVPCVTGPVARNSRYYWYKQ